MRIILVSGVGLMLLTAVVKAQDAPAAAVPSKRQAAPSQKHAPPRDPSDPNNSAEANATVRAGVVAAAPFEIETRMEIDVDGAPNAYGPPGKKTLDYLINAHYMERGEEKIVGYLLEDDDPKMPVIQGPQDPFPGYYVSTTLLRIAR